MDWTSEEYRLAAIRKMLKCVIQQFAPDLTYISPTVKKTISYFWMMSLFMNMIDGEMEIGFSTFLYLLKNNGYLVSFDMEAVNTKQICRAVPMVCIPSSIVPLICIYHHMSTRGIHIRVSHAYTDSGSMVVCIAWSNYLRLYPWRPHTRHCSLVAVHASLVRWSSRRLRWWGWVHSTALQDAPVNKAS